MTLGERTRHILEASVREFIETGLPITSAGLYRKYDFGIKPAMIRWELHDLTTRDFFSQPHPSGGRIPSDRAYRFFAESILDDLRDGDEEEYGGKKVREIVELASPGREKEFIRQFAAELGCLGACFDTNSLEFWQSGLPELIRGIGIENRENIWKVARDFEMIPERLMNESDWWEEEPIWPRVFIGRSPVTKSAALSVVAGKAGEGRLLILAIGPKRMDYERSVKLVKHLQKIYE